MRFTQEKKFSFTLAHSEGSVYNLYSWASVLPVFLLVSSRWRIIQPNVWWLLYTCHLSFKAKWVIRGTTCVVLVGVTSLSPCPLGKHWCGAGMLQPFSLGSYYVCIIGKTHDFLLFLQCTDHRESSHKSVSEVRERCHYSSTQCHKSQTYCSFYWLLCSEPAQGLCHTCQFHLRMKFFCDHPTR